MISKFGYNKNFDFIDYFKWPYTSRGRLTLNEQLRVYFETLMKYLLLNYCRSLLFEKRTLHSRSNCRVEMKKRRL